MEERVSNTIQPQMREVIKVLMDEDRLNILLHLNGGAQSVTELADTLEIESSSASHKLKKLRDAGLIEMQRLKKLHFYSLTGFVNVERDAADGIEIIIRNDFDEYLTLCFKPAKIIF